MPLKIDFNALKLLWHIKQNITISILRKKKLKIVIMNFILRS